MEEIIVICDNEPCTIWAYDFAKKEFQGIKKVHNGDRIIELEGFRLRFMSARYYCKYGQYGRRNAKTIDGNEFIDFLEKFNTRQSNVSKLNTQPIDTKNI